MNEAEKNLLAEILAEMPPVQLRQKVFRRIEAKGKDRIRNGEYQWQWQWERNSFGEIILINCIGIPYSRWWRNQ